LNSLNRDSGVHQGSLRTAIFNPAITGSRANFLQISSADIVKGVFEISYAQSQINSTLYGVSVLGGTAAIYAAPTLATGTAAWAGRVGVWASRNARSLCLFASLCTLTESSAGNIIIYSYDDVLRALQTRESIQRGINATKGIRSIGGP